MIRSLNRFAHMAVCGALAALATVTTQAAVIQGPAFISASTALPTCGAVCGGVGSNIAQIADGDTSNFNGWAGADGVVGIIKLDLLGNYNLDSFSLWNDINVLREGVGDFRLHFYDAADVLLSTSGTFIAPISTLSAGVYALGSVQNVSRVDLEVLTLLTGGVCCRIEIREVAFNGERVATQGVPEPGTWTLAALGLGALGLGRRRARLR